MKPAQSSGSADTSSTSANAFRRLPWTRYLLLAAWCVASASPLRWMFAALAQPEHVVQRGVLFGLLGLGFYYFLAGKPAPQTHPRALLIVLLAIACEAILRVSTSVHAIHAAVALLLLYALGALFMDANAWRRRLVLLVVLLLCLPVQPHVDAYLGLPLRLWTAQAVAPLLQVLGAANVTVESIIVTENGVADVASACSGVRTLWYAMALWLGTRLVFSQASLRRWWLAGALSVAVAIAFNALRVTALVLALHHHAPQLLVEIAHSSLGLLALAAVGGVNFMLCRGTLAILPPPVVHSVRPKQGARHESWQTIALLAGFMAGVTLLPSPARSDTAAAQLTSLHWPAAFQLQTLPLSPEEQGLVLGHHATVAEKHLFKHQGLHGSLLVVESSNWRAQHAPELCLLAQGAHVEQLLHVATPDGEFRVMSLQAGTQTAITWFQSGNRIVADLGTRWWSQLWHPQERWALVTLVVDGSPLESSSNAALLNLHYAVKAVVTPSQGEIL